MSIRLFAWAENQRKPEAADLSKGGLMLGCGTQP
jgi:hypothetical protein